MKRIIFLLCFVFLASCSLTKTPSIDSADVLLPLTSVEEYNASTRSLYSGENYDYFDTETIKIGDTKVIIPILSNDELNKLLLHELTLFLTNIDAPFQPDLIDFYCDYAFDTVSLTFYISNSELVNAQKLYFSYNITEEKPASLESFFDKNDYKKIINKYFDGNVDNIKGFSVNENGIDAFTEAETVFISASYFKDNKLFYVFDPDNYNPVNSKNEKYVALTFDDGPNPYTTSKLLDMLNDKGVKATFFMVGYNIEEYKGLVKRVYNEGHDIGIHSYKHSDYSTMSAEKVLEDIDKCANLIYSIIDRRPYLVRPPFGSININDVITNDYFFVNWNVDPLDWKYDSPEEIANEALKFIKPGSIVLLHDIFKSSCDAAEIIIDDLIKDGYRFVTVSEYFDLNKNKADNKLHFFKEDYDVKND